jgi:hypothetical protein
VHIVTSLRSDGRTRVTELLLFLWLFTLFAENSAATTPTVSQSLIGVSWEGFTYRIDPLTGGSVELSRPGIPFNSLARDLAGNFIAGGGGVDDNLYRINPVDGSAQLMTHIITPGFETIRGLAFAPNDDLFAIERPWSTSTGRSVNYLYKIDVDTGNATLVGETGLFGLQSLAISKEGAMYSFDLEGNGLGLVTIDPVSGIASDVNPTDNAQGSGIQSLAFSSNGSLYAMGQGAIYTVNVSNGSLSRLVNFNVDIRGIEFLPIPEPSTAALVMTLICAASSRRCRRKSENNYIPG